MEDVGANDAGGPRSRFRLSILFEQVFARAVVIKLADGLRSQIAFLFRCRLFC